jgi:hypothetical protein
VSSGWDAYFDERGRRLAAEAKLAEAVLQCEEVAALRSEVERLRSERAIIDRELRKSNLDATRWFIVEALAPEVSA